MLKSFVARMRQRVRGSGKSNREIFDNVYSKKIWRGEGDISSGLGSQPQNSRPYEDLIVDYVLTNNITSIVDVGCGDFQVSGRILDRLPDTVVYTGLDVSQVAIDRNIAKFGSDRVSFIRADAATEPLPAGDLVLVREVLQHIPNADILKILPKLDSFPHVLLTNTIKRGAKPLNIDIAAGSASRAGLGSGLWLDLPPFSRTLEPLLTVSHDTHSTDIITSRMLSTH